MLVACLNCLQVREHTEKACAKCHCEAIVIALLANELEPLAHPIADGWRVYCEEFMPPELEPIKDHLHSIFLAGAQMMRIATEDGIYEAACKELAEFQAMREREAAGSTQ